MKKIALFLILFAAIFSACKNKEDKNQIRAFCIDYNWGPGGAHGFAAPGLWADADPEEQVKWYEELGCNTIQTFAVSCNGYAWYKNGFVPEQPGLKHDFLTEMVKLGHKKHMKVFAYFCAGANNKWEQDHPDLCYGTDGEQIPYTTEYLDYLCSSIEDAIKKTGIDGFMLDWFYTPSGGWENPRPLKWIPCEQQMYAELMNEPFPGAENVTPGDNLEFRRRSINRAWERIHSTAKGANPGCLIWLTSYNLESSEIAGSALLKEADWVMNEAGDMASIDKVRAHIGQHAKLITCLANWNQKDPETIVPAAIKAGVGLYGFTKPVDGNIMPPVTDYLSKAVSEFSGDAKNIAVLARVYNGFPIDYVKK